MAYVYIPFGSMGIRPMCLQHSGHYGSPGNTRFHATFYIRGKTEHNTKELGYLHKLLADKKGPFGKHALQWSREYYQQPMAPLKDPSKLVALFKDAEKKSLGTNYWQMITKHKSDYICLLTYLLNPSDEAARAHARKLIFKRSVGSKKVALQPQRKRQRTQRPVLPVPQGNVAPPVLPVPQGNVAPPVLPVPQGNVVAAPVLPVPQGNVVAAPVLPVPQGNVAAPEVKPVPKGDEGKMVSV
jgi:hypothetical protein